MSELADGQPMIEDAYQEEQMTPAFNSTDHFVHCIDSTDFLVEDQDEGLGGYADCEMMVTEFEAPTFTFEN